MNYNLEEMKNVDLKKVNINELVDIRNIHIDESQEVSERVKQFIEQIGNPYCFKVGNVVVKVSYNQQGSTFQRNFESMISAM